MTELTNRVAVVTGGGRGIGLGYARALARAGASIVIADIDVANARSAVDELCADGAVAVAHEVDISDPESVTALAAQVRDRFGGAQILVNNAAMFHSMRQQPLLEQDLDYWRTMFHVNVDGALLMSQAFAPMMIEAGWGRIVNQSSTAAFLGGGRVYAVTKLALVGLTQGLANELGPHNVTVNAIAPGPIFTDALRSVVSDDVVGGLTSRMAIKREAEPDDLSGVVAFLCSEAAGWMTGQVLVVDGGTVKLT